MTTSSTITTNGTGASPTKCDVCVVGAGPAGVMLATLLARFGIHVQILDDRPDQTTVGRADGLQPKTIETFQMLRLGHDLLDTGVKVFDICMWSSEGSSQGQRRVGREVHYPPGTVDVLHPFILLCHQGMVEGMLVDDLRHSGVHVHRGHTFDAFSYHHHDDDDNKSADKALQATFHRTTEEDTTTTTTTTVRLLDTDYLVGCDGARSRVRQGLPDAYAEGNPHDSYWGVLDGELATDFPDLWSKTVVYSEVHGSVLIIPRERNLTRFYIEVKRNHDQQSVATTVDETFVMDQARKIMAPYTLEWLSVEWFGNYRVTQRVAARFTDGPLPSSSSSSSSSSSTAANESSSSSRTSGPHVFIAGDASHTHSPKAAQGMNTSMHDSWNLGWKLNLAVRGLARRAVLLGSYESERQKIARDLIHFDYEHATRIAGGDAQALADNFRTNIGFISGVGVQYEANVLNPPPVSLSFSLEQQSSSSSPVADGHVPEQVVDVTSTTTTTTTTRNRGGLEEEEEREGGAARPGRNLPPAKVTRCIDDNPVDLQLDIPVLGQFRVLLVVPDLARASGFLRSFSQGVLSSSSLLARLSAAAKTSYQRMPRPTRPKDVYYRPERYTPLSELFTFGLITSSNKNTFELASLPPLLRQSKWTVYLDNVPHLDTLGQKCTDKWLGAGFGAEADEVAVVNVRPDGYVGAIMRYQYSPDDHCDSSASSGEEAGAHAARALDAYYGGFLEVPLS